MTPYLEQIAFPSDLKKLSVPELPLLAEEIRQLLIQKVTATGGHMGSNLGFIEATVALHYVFNTPEDKVIFDVSHQCYTHKILTGRKAGFLDPAAYHTFSGYTNPGESSYDSFIVGHTSTSISLATGMAQARDLRGGTERIVAIIGDGSMSGGEALEGLDNAAMLNSQMLIIFNDNEMSIAKNHGGIYRNFEELRATKGEADCNFFKAFGFDYLYVEEGNDTAKLVAALERVKDAKHPVVLHIHTEKGKGLPWAEADKEAGHWTMPASFDQAPNAKQEHYESITADFLLQKMKQDPTVIAITPATPGATGFTQDFRAQAGKQYIDVGIAEEHAVAFASGLAKNGAKPVLAALGMFLQRTYDQLAQDLALNNSAATILAFWGGISSSDATHSGAFDISMMSNIPNLVCLAPATKEEYLSMLDWSIEQTRYPVAIRVPGEVVSTGIPVRFTEAELKKYVVATAGDTVAIFGLGDFFHLGKEVQELLKAKAGINATLINPRNYSDLDEETLKALQPNHSLAITLENGILDGGFGQKIAGFYGPTAMKVLTIGGKKEFTDRVSEAELNARYKFSKEAIVAEILKLLN